MSGLTLIAICLGAVLTNISQAELLENSELREKAKFFGQSPEERLEVRNILQTVSQIVSTRFAATNALQRDHGDSRLLLGPDNTARHPSLTRKNLNFLGHNFPTQVLKGPSAISSSEQQGSEAAAALRGFSKVLRDKPFLNAHDADSLYSPSSERLSEKRDGQRSNSEQAQDDKNSKELADQIANAKLNYYKYKVENEGLTTGRFMDDQWGDDAPDQSLSIDRFEGDIVLWKDQAENLLNQVLHQNDRRRKRKFIRSSIRKWDASRPIEYSFDGSHTTKQREYIELALEHWQNITCLNFMRRDDKPTGNRIVFTDVDGCASNVGRHPLGEPQFVSIANECLRLGVIAHEVAHALGFWHEQSRPDRDDFVTVMWKNIEWGSAGQFTKELFEDVDNRDIAYDYGSIMHYRSKAFSRNDDLYTIQTNIADYQKTIGQRDQLSFNDIKLMNSMYCSGKCPKELPCQRGGYTDPRNCERCRCPDGFTGRYCESVMKGFGQECGGVLNLSTQTFKTLSSPGYPSYFKKGQECSFLLKAPYGMHVEIEFVGEFDMYCKAQQSLCMDYVEIRNSTKFSNTGMRYCCSAKPQEKIYSATHEMLVLFRSFYQQGRGFKAQAKAVPASASWGDWGSWSACSASCGGCGTKIRYRSCPTGVCTGKGVETQSCNTQTCGVCAQPKKIVVPCGLWGLFRCEKVTNEYIPCKDQCCPGYSTRNDRCVLNDRGSG